MYSQMTPILVPVLALLLMAFFTLLERKILGLSQSRKGPNKVSLIGLFQPLADALKLFSKKDAHLHRSNKFLFLLFPLSALSLATASWSLFPSSHPAYFFPLSAIFLLALSALNVYWVLGSGWTSNSKYSLLGALRSVAQTISYEIPLAISLLSFLICIHSLSLSAFTSYPFIPLFLLLLPSFLVWLFCILAETSRAPFDHAESESELVSGFNTEYGGGKFALLFMAEYVIILFFSSLTPFLSFPGAPLPTLLSLSLLTACAIIWIRTTLPRLRYDILMDVSWKAILPISISVLTLSLALI